MLLFRFKLNCGLSLFAVLVAGVPSPALAASSLTLEAAQRLAIQQSRKLAAGDASIAASRAMALAAGQLPDPVLKVGIDNLPVSGPDRFSLSSDFMTMRRVGVMQELPGAAKRQLRAGRFERAADKAAAEKTLAAATIERDTALAWFELYFAGAMAQVVREQVGEAELELKAAEGGFKGGRGGLADVLAARGALAMLGDRASDAARRVQSGRIGLARWVGPVDQLQLAGLPDLEHVRIEAASIGSQLGHHPQIAVLEGEEGVARAEVKLAEANRHADWSVEVAFQQRGAAYSNMLSVGLSIPLQWDRANRQDRELAARLAQADAARAERDDALRAHVAETKAMLGDWHNGRERLARYRGELIGLASERTAATLAAYRGGKSSLPEVLAARRGEIDVRLQAIQLDADTAKLWVQLNFMAAASQPNKETP
jgi:outer membrane protein TolC